jgi:hypothetical protein
MITRCDEILENEYYKLIWFRISIYKWIYEYPKLYY